jgi:hypothetical protein
VLTEDEKEQARQNIGAQQQLQLTVKDNGNIVLSNLNGQSQEFMPATPSGDPMHWAYVSAGAEYNDTGADITKTGVYGDTIIHKANHWYLNEIGDLTTQEMAEIYSQRWPSRCTPISQYFWGVKSRTACIGLSSSSALSNYLFYHCGNIEKLKLTNDISNLITLSSTTMASIINLSSLTKILTILKANNTTAFDSWFVGCVALEEVRISGLKCHISFKVCSNISKTSVKYMVEKATPTSAITITLHHDAYERLKGDADILQALTTKNADLANTGDGKGKVSLVCATDNDTIPSE